MTEPDTAWMEFASKAKPRKRKPKASEAGPCVRALQQAAIVQARLKSGELTRDEASRLVDAIVQGVE